MDMDHFSESLKAMEILSARETLKSLSVQDWPTLKSQDRDKFHREISKSAAVKKKIVRMDEIDSFLGKL